jgi:hypothetical protein
MHNKLERFALTNIASIVSSFNVIMWPYRDMISSTGSALECASKIRLGWKCWKESNGLAYPK